MSNKDADGFYSDSVEKQLNFTSLMMYSDYVKFINNHLQECNQFILDNPGITSIYVNFIKDPESQQLKCFINGQVPWEQSKVDEFKKIVSEEKDEVFILKKLLDKYPDKALNYLADAAANKKD